MTAPYEGDDAARTLGRALRLRWYLVVLVVLVCVAGALVGQLQRPVHRTAEARLLFGNTDVTANQVPGYVAANTSLAATYARVATTTAVESMVTAALASQGMTPVAYTVSPVADTPLLLVEATDTDGNRAEATVAAASTALSQFVKSSNDRQAQLDAATKQAAAAQAALAQATVAYTALQQQYTDTPVAERQALEGPLATALAAQGLAQQQVTAAAGTLTQATQLLSSQVEAAQVGAPAVVRDDRRAGLSRAGLAGAVVGLFLGVVVALLSSRARSATPRHEGAALPTGGPDALGGADSDGRRHLPAGEELPSSTAAARA